MKRLRRLGRVARIAALGAGGALVLALVLLSQARAEAEEQLWRMGRVLTSIGEQGDASGEPRTLVVNGAEVVIRSESTLDNLETALDRADDRCDGVSVGGRSTTLRAQNHDEGFVACFLGIGAMDRGQLMDAGEAFILDGDVSRLGPFDYTFVRRTEAGVHQLRVRIPHLDIEAMFPEVEDAPGLDVDGVPRPPASQRILSAFNVDEPYQISIYRGHGASPARLAEGYRRELVAAGWRVRAGRVTDDKVTLVAFRRSKMVAIVMRATEGAVTTTIAAGL